MNHLKYRKTAIKALKRSIMKSIKSASKNGEFSDVIYVDVVIFDVFIKYFLEKNGFYCEKLETTFEDKIKLKISWLII